MFIARVTAPHKALLFHTGKPQRVLEPGVHWILPILQTVKRISCALHTHEVDVDVITRGGTPTSIKVGYTARVTDVRKALINVSDPFATLRASVISVVSGAANEFTIDQLAEKKGEIAGAAESELRGLSERFGWGLGDFQIAVGDPSMSEELKKLLMREEAVRRENAANLGRARNQSEVARELLQVATALQNSPFARELLRMQMLTDMGEGGKVIVIDSKLVEAPTKVLVSEAIESVAAPSNGHSAAAT